MITLAYWQLWALLTLAAFVGFLFGIGAMAAMAMAGYSDDVAEIEEGEHQ